MDAFPAVPGLDGLAQDINVFQRIHAVIRRRPLFREVGKHCTASGPVVRKVEQAAVSLAGVRECFPLVEVDVEQPLARPRLMEADGRSFAVVEDVGIQCPQADSDRSQQTWIIKIWVVVVSVPRGPTNSDLIESASPSHRRRPPWGIATKRQYDE